MRVNKRGLQVSGFHPMHNLSDAHTNAETFRAALQFGGAGKLHDIAGGEIDKQQAATRISL